MVLSTLWMTEILYFLPNRLYRTHRRKSWVGVPWIHKIPPGSFLHKIPSAMRITRSATSGQTPSQGHPNMVIPSAASSFIPQTLAPISGSRGSWLVNSITSGCIAKARAWPPAAAVRRKALADSCPLYPPSQPAPAGREPSSLLVFGIFFKSPGAR